MALPCGYVVADYRAPVLEVEMVSLEGSAPTVIVTIIGLNLQSILNELDAFDTRTVVKQTAS